MVRLVGGVDRLLSVVELESGHIRPLVEEIVVEAADYVIELGLLSEGLGVSENG